MPNIRVIFKFSVGKSGWSETWWYYLNTQGLDAAMASAQALAPMRANLNGANTKLETINVSYDDPDRLGLIFTYPNGGLTTSLFKAFGSMQPSVGLLFNVIGTTGIRRPTVIRGLPDDLESDGGQYNPASVTGFNNALNVWKNGVIALNMGIRKSTITNVSQITAMANVKPKYVDVTVDNLLLYQAGELVAITGGGQAQGLAGRHRVQFVSGVLGSQVLRVKSPYAVGGFVAGGAYVGSVAYTTDATFSMTSERIVKRDTGRPLNVSLGKRSPVRQV